MATYALYDGGSVGHQTDQLLYPQSDNTVLRPQPYADHQRAKYYNLTKVLDFRAPTPYGGGGKDLSFNAYLDSLVAAGTTSLLANDELQLIRFHPNSRLISVHWDILNPATFTFTLSVKSAAGVVQAVTPAAPVTSPIDASVLTTNADGVQVANYMQEVGVEITRHCSLNLIVAANTTIASLRAAGLRMWFSAEVVWYGVGNER